jgi:hypothetical protein
VALYGSPDGLNKRVDEGASGCSVVFLFLFVIDKFVFNLLGSTLWTSGGRGIPAVVLLLACGPTGWSSVTQAMCANIMGKFLNGRGANITGRREYYFKTYCRYMYMYVCMLVTSPKHGRIGRDRVLRQAEVLSPLLLQP